MIKTKKKLRYKVGDVVLSKEHLDARIYTIMYIQKVGRKTIYLVGYGHKDYLTRKQIKGVIVC